MNKIAGLFFFIGGSTILLGILTAEIFYNAVYSISQNMISTLGASPPPHSIIREPSASIFDGAMFISGIVIMIGGYILSKKYKKTLAISIVLMGFGAFGVGIFPAFHPLIHPLFALLTFTAGGVAALLSSKETLSPFSFFSFGLGLLSLLFLFSGLFLPHIIIPILGAGGVERWVAYPIMIWFIAFGGYLMNTKK